MAVGLGFKTHWFRLLFDVSLGGLRFDVVWWSRNAGLWWDCAKCACLSAREGQRLDIVCASHVATSAHAISYMYILFLVDTQLAIAQQSSWGTSGAAGAHCRP